MRYVQLRAFHHVAICGGFSRAAEELLLTQPAIAATVGWLAFGELLAPLDVVGMVLVGTALVLARAGRPGRVR